MCYTNGRLHTLQLDTRHTDFTVWCKFDLILTIPLNLKVCGTKSKKKTKIACLPATFIALCERVCYPNPTYKELNDFTPKQILPAHHLNIRTFV